MVWRGAVVAAATLVVALGLFVLFEGSAPDLPLAAPARSVPPELIRLDSAEGTRLLFESEAYAAFAPLISHFETQKSLTHCGPASIAMVLNALQVPAPIADAYGTYRLFTQDNVLNALTEPIITDRAVERRPIGAAVRHEPGERFLRVQHGEAVARRGIEAQLSQGSSVCS